jgi:AcrR family transcriptional regulator
MTQQISRPRRERRTQQERSSATTNDLLTAARELFARHGFAAVSTEAVCDRAKVTKGALYHHFKTKKDLFRAVYEREQQRLSMLVAQTYAQYGDPWEGLFQGTRAFLVHSMAPAVQRITLIDAPSALSWEVMREIRADCRRMMRYGLRSALGRDRFSPHEIESLTSLLYGAQIESVMAIAHAEEPDALLQATLEQMRLFFRSLEEMSGTRAADPAPTHPSLLTASPRA